MEDLGDLFAAQEVWIPLMVRTLWYRYLLKIFWQKYLSKPIREFVVRYTMKDFKSKVRELQLFIVIFISLSTHDLKKVSEPDIHERT